jgi:hypothetical protein
MVNAETVARGHTVDRSLETGFCCMDDAAVLTSNLDTRGVGGNNGSGLELVAVAHFATRLPVSVHTECLTLTQHSIP